MAKTIHVAKAQQRWVRDDLGKKTDQPKPLEVCDFDGKDIEVGTPYKHITIKTGQRSSRRFTRHEGCPDWHSWELRTTAATTIERAVYDFGEAVKEASDADEFTSAADDLTSTINEVAGEKRESAENIREGFNDTPQSQELDEVADELEAWAQEIEDFQPEDPPEKCATCDGTGEIAVDGENDEIENDECPDCDGVEFEEALNDWRNEQTDQYNLDGSPL